MTRLLLVEDDAALREGIADLLHQAGHEVVSSGDGRDALARLVDSDFDVAIVDLGLPGMDGIELLRALRRRQIGLPVLVITARDSLHERITGLDAGADDYLVKPFEMAEFEARVRALLRRQRADRGAEIRVGALRFTPGQPQVTVGDMTVELGPTELTLLELLARHPGRIVSKDKIAGRIARGGERPSDTAIEVSVHRLRRKLAPFGISIRALRGFGYLLEASAGV